MTEKSVDELIADLWQLQSTAISRRCRTKVSKSRSSGMIENEKAETVPQKKEPVIRKNQKCLHNKRVSLCKECGGEYLCQHDRVKRQCKLCSGASMCVHGRRVALCRECGGSALCEHGRQKRQCKTCKSTAGTCLQACRRTIFARELSYISSGLCSHGRAKQFCRDCSGSGICPHGRQKYLCRDCGGSGLVFWLLDSPLTSSCHCTLGLCAHGRQKNFCVSCKGKWICKHLKQAHCCKLCKAEKSHL